MGWQGYMIANGLVWFEHGNNGWYIKGFNNWNRKLDNTNKYNLWDFENKIISPLCFSHKWYSGDNYEMYEEIFNISNSRNFKLNPGIYFGNKINTYEPIDVGWDIELALPYNLNRCLIDKNLVENNDDINVTYKILGKISNKKCQELAPNIKGICLESYMVNIVADRNSAIGPHNNTLIYGLFEIINNKYIIPLKYFENKNTGLNYLDNSNP
jgi:hypothetical protein